MQAPRSASQGSSVAGSTVPDVRDNRSRSFGQAGESGSLQPRDRLLSQNSVATTRSAADSMQARDLRSMSIGSASEAGFAAFEPSARTNMQPGQTTEIYQEVSSLVEELEAARACALAAGGRLPRAVEAAASALEPLLRLRDVAGAVACDLSLMPWLPQLLAVFRNVLRTAVDGIGIGAKPGQSTPRLSRGGSEEPDVAAASSLDAGAAGSMTGAAAAAAATAAAVMAAVRAGNSEARDGSGEARAECEQLQRRIRAQDQQVSELRESESRLRREAEELRIDRGHLLRRIEDLEMEAVHAASGESSSSRPSGDARHASSDAGLAEPGSPEWLARRVSDLETENRAYRTECSFAEGRMNELADLMQSAIQVDSVSGVPAATSASTSSPAAPSGGRSGNTATRERLEEEQVHPRGSRTPPRTPPRSAR